MPLPTVGETAPNFNTQTDTGADVALEDYRGKKIVLYFYPKADTPGCTKQACFYRDNYKEFEKRGVTVLGISHDTVEEQAAFKEKFNLPFTLLADPEHQIADEYGVWVERTIEREGKTRTVVGIQRSTLILDEAGQVIYSKRGVDPANDTEEVLSQL